MPSTPAAASFFNSKNAQRSASTVTWWRSVVRRFRGSRSTNCRIRSAACDTLSRSCVRRVLWLSRFPLGPVLRSIDSAGDRSPLFADFTANIPESCMSRFSAWVQKVIHSGWGGFVGISPVLAGGAGLWWQGDFAPLCGHTQGSGMRGSNDLRESGLDRSSLGFGAVRQLGRPAFLDVPCVLNGCLGSNRIIARQGARDDG